MRFRAAGQTLSVGELREALAPLDEHAAVYLSDGAPLVVADNGTMALGLEMGAADRDDMLEALSAFVIEIGDGDIKGAQIRKRAIELTTEYEIEG